MHDKIETLKARRVWQSVLLFRTASPQKTWHGRNYDHNKSYNYANKSWTMIFQWFQISHKHFAVFFADT